MSIEILLHAQPVLYVSPGNDIFLLPAGSKNEEASDLYHQVAVVLHRRGVHGHHQLSGYLQDDRPGTDPYHHPGHSEDHQHRRRGGDGPQPVSGQGISIPEVSTH